MPSRSRRTIAHRRSLLRPPSFEAGHRDPDRSLYWRSRRGLLLDLDRGRSAGALVLRRSSRHRRIGRLPAARPVPPLYTFRVAPNAKKGAGRIGAEGVIRPYDRQDGGLRPSLFELRRTSRLQPARRRLTRATRSSTWTE